MVAPRYKSTRLRNMGILRAKETPDFVDGDYINVGDIEGSTGIVAGRKARAGVKRGD